EAVGPLSELPVAGHDDPVIVRHGDEIAVAYLDAIVAASPPITKSSTAATDDAFEELETLGIGEASGVSVGDAGPDSGAAGPADGGPAGGAGSGAGPAGSGPAGAAGSGAGAAGSGAGAAGSGRGSAGGDGADAAGAPDGGSGTGLVLVYTPLHGV